MVALKRLLLRWRCDKGAEFVEFALAFPLLLLVVMGIIDFGILFQQYQVLVAAAREGARVAVLPNYSLVNGEDRAAAYINASIMNQGSVLVTSGTYRPVATLQANVPVGSQCMSTVTVTATYPHQYLFLAGIGSYFGGSFGTKVLSATAIMRREITAGTCS